MSPSGCGQRSRFVHPALRRRACGVALAAMAAGLWGGAAEAASRQQVFELRPGWNAVALELDPVPSQADALFDGLPITAVWTREEEDPAGRGAACSADAHSSECIRSTTTGWRVWFPPATPQHVVNSLHVVGGGRVYLVQASAAATLTVTGAPHPGVQRWREGFNLTGFHVVDEVSAAPTFADYLGPAPALAGGLIYRIEPSGLLSPVLDPAVEKIAGRHGYWVEAFGSAVYDGPIQIDPASLRGVLLAPGIVEHAIRVENHGSAAVQVNVSNRPAERGAAGVQAELPLMFRDFSDPGQPEWKDLSNLTLELKPAGEPGSSQVVHVGVRRQDLPANDQAGAGLEGLLEITDSSGYQRFIPTAAGPGGQDGLWVGHVVITDVESITDPAGSSATPAEFTFRIIVHKGSTGYRLLREVMLVWEDNGSGGSVTELRTPQCAGSFDDVQVASRISSANFSFDGAIPLAGSFATSLAPAAPLNMAFNHELNPFRHPFNPEHTAGFNITRQLTLSFDDGGGDPEWGVTRLGGTYQESVLGLHRQAVQASGRFELRRISEISTVCGL